MFPQALSTLTGSACKRVLGLVGWPYCFRSMYVYMYVCIYVYICAYVYSYMFHVSVYMCICIGIGTRICICAYAYTCMYMCLPMCTCAHVCICVCIGKACSFLRFGHIGRHVVLGDVVAGTVAAGAPWHDEPPGKPCQSCSAGFGSLRRSSSSSSSVTQLYHSMRELQK